MRNRDGHVVGSNEKACTLADHFEHIQWACKFCTLAPQRVPIGDELHVNTDLIDKGELYDAVKHLKANKASGDDDIPAEFWKALIGDADNEAFSYIMSFCNQVWQRKSV